MSSIDPPDNKGALFILDQTSGLKRTMIPFHYNPETVKRTLKPRMPTTEKGHPAQNLRFSGAPEESITLEIHIDATDDLEKGTGDAQKNGIHPQLAALELLVFPKSKDVKDSDKLLEEGQLEIGGAEYDAPLVLFTWGKNRVLPVRVTNISISETIFDTHLNPIQATATLSLEALTYSDLDRDHQGYGHYMTYHVNKEKIANPQTNGQP